MSILKAVRGTRDLLPPETELWNRIELTARAVFTRYNFGEIRTPIFEDTQLFARGVGAETDIVSKEMYTWEDRARAQSDKAQSLTLRPENTAGVVRAYIEHGLGESGLLQKLYYIGPQFRHERPQKGRYRQFYQIGAEVIGPPSAGSESPLRDAELLEMLATFLDELGITGWKLLINSVGSASDRPRYIAVLKEALREVAPRMCSDCQRRAETNPLRVLDCKVPEDQPIIEQLPSILDYLCEDCKPHFDTVRRLLTDRGIPFEVQPRLVRGLDYYMRTTFEVIHGALGAQNSVLGGGRYDGLAESLGSKVPAPGIGFSIGEDRLVMTVEESMKGRPLDLFVAALGEGAIQRAGQLTRDARQAGYSVEMTADGKLKRAMELANKLGARYALIVGENEIAAGRYALKNMASGQQEEVAPEQIAERLQNIH
jgi:histidyl-tRNA synthetase